MKTICYFDQENLAIEIFKDLFKETSYNFFSSGDLEDYYMCFDQDPRVILVDLKFSVDKIAEFVHNLSKESKLENVSIVGVGFLDEINFFKKNVDMFFSFIEKPVSIEDLVIKIKDIVEKE